MMALERKVHVLTEILKRTYYQPVGANFTAADINEFQELAAMGIT